jgi:anti-sigma factor RsiW
MTDAVPPLTDADRTELVAYLAGELPADAATVIASRLAREPALRHEADRLDTSWALLDHLATPEASPQLATQTLTRIRQLETVSGHRPVAGQSGERRFPGWLQAAAFASVVGLASCAGYALAGWISPPKDRRVLTDLSLAENLEEYRAVGTWDFATRLAALPEPEP